MGGATIEQATPFGQRNVVQEAIPARVTSQITTDPSGRDHQQRERWRHIVRLADLKMVYLDPVNRKIGPFFHPDLHNGTE